MSAAKTIYEGYNNELKEELPVLYERWENIHKAQYVRASTALTFDAVMFLIFSRIGCYVSVFSAVSNLRSIFYKEMATVCSCSLLDQHLDSVGTRCLNIFFLSSLSCFSWILTSRTWLRSCKLSIQTKCSPWGECNGEITYHFISERLSGCPVPLEWGRTTQTNSLTGEGGDIGETSEGGSIPGEADVTNKIIKSQNFYYTQIVKYVWKLQIQFKVSPRDPDRPHKY